jgi:hypothetical protein
MVHTFERILHVRHDIRWHVRCGSNSNLARKPDCRCMQAWFFLLLFARVSFDRPPDPHPSLPPLPFIPLLEPWATGKLVQPIWVEVDTDSGHMGRPTAKSPEEKALTKSLGLLGKRCWDDGLGDLLKDRGVDTSNATWTHGGLYMGALCGLWTFDAHTGGDFKENPQGLAAFAALAPGLLKEVIIHLYIY